MTDTFNTTVQNVYNKLNNGLSWDKIEKTIYPEIEEKREQNASVSEFAKLIFKIETTNKLEYIRQNISAIQKQKSRISVTCYNPPPNSHARYFHDIVLLVKDENINLIPFLKDNIIEIVPREGEARFHDC